MSTQIADLVAQIAKNLPDMSASQMQGWIQNPMHLKRVLSILARAPSDPEAWKRISLGTMDAMDFVGPSSFKDEKMMISNWANGVLGGPQFTMVTERADVNLVVVSVEDLASPMVLGFGKSTPQPRSGVWSSVLRKSVPNCVCSIRISPRTSGS